MIPDPSISSSLFIPLTSRCAERAFSRWDRHYDDNVFTSSAFVERSLFLSQFSYPTVLKALKATPPAQGNIDFVWKLEHRPKRVKEEMDAWENLQKLARVKNHKSLLKDASVRLYNATKAKTKIPWKGNTYNTKNFYVKTLQHLTETNFPDVLIQKTSLSIVRSTSILFAHQTNIIHLCGLQVELLSNTLPNQHSPFLHLVDLRPNAIQRFKHAATLSLELTETENDLGGQVDGIAVDRGQRIHVSNVSNDRMRGAIILDWVGDEKMYEVSLEEIFISEPRESFSGEHLDLLLTYWETEKLDIVMVAEREEIVEMESQQKYEEGECKKIIKEMQEIEGRIVGCKKFCEKVNGRSGRTRTKKILRYKITDGERRLWVKHEELEKKSLVLDFWEGLDPGAEEGGEETQGDEWEENQMQGRGKRRKRSRSNSSGGPHGKDKRKRR